MNLKLRALWLVGLVGALYLIVLWFLPEAPMLWRAPLALLLLAVVADVVLAARRPLSLVRELPPRLVLGELATIRYRLGAPEFGALAVEFAEHLPEVFEGHLLSGRLSAPGSAGLVALERRVCALGEVHWGELRTRLTGPLGLVDVPRRLLVPGYSRVEPRGLSSRDLRAVSMEGTARHQPRTGHGLEFLGHRNYVSGDSPKQIDWKASARAQKLLLRLGSEDAQLHLVIAIDRGAGTEQQLGALSQLGATANLAARLGERALRQGDTVGLLIYSDQIEHASFGLRGPSALSRLRAPLSLLRTAPAFGNPLVAAIEISQRVPRRALVVMLADLEAPPAASQLRASLRLLARRHVCVIAAPLAPQLLADHERRAEEPLGTELRLAAGLQMRALAQTRQRLIESGARVVLDVEQRLDERVIETYLHLRRARQVS